MERSEGYNPDLEKKAAAHDQEANQPEIILPKNIGSSKELARKLEFVEADIQSTYYYIFAKEQPVTVSGYQGTEVLIAEQATGKEQLSLGVVLPLFPSEITKLVLLEEDTLEGLEEDNKEHPDNPIIDPEILRQAQAVATENGYVSRKKLEKGGYQAVGRLIQALERTTFLTEDLEDLIRLYESAKRIAQIVEEEFTKTFPQYGVLVDGFKEPTPSIYLLNPKRELKSGRVRSIRFRGFRRDQLDFTLGTANPPEKDSNVAFDYTNLKKIKERNEHPQTNYWKYNPEDPESIRKTMQAIIQELRLVEEFTKTL